MGFDDKDRRGLDQEIRDRIARDISRPQVVRSRRSPAGPHQHAQFEATAPAETIRSGAYARPGAA